MKVAHFYWVYKSELYSNNQDKNIIKLSLIVFRLNLSTNVDKGLYLKLTWKLT